MQARMAEVEIEIEFKRKEVTDLSAAEESMRDRVAISIEKLGSKGTFTKVAGKGAYQIGDSVKSGGSKCSVENLVILFAGVGVGILFGAKMCKK